MDFNKMIKEAMAQGMTADDVAKQFTKAMNEATKVDAVKEFCDKVYKTTGIQPSAIAMKQAADILVGTIVQGKDLDKKDIESMRETMSECARLAEGIIGKNDDEIMDFILKEVASLFN